MMNKQEVISKLESFKNGGYWEFDDINGTEVSVHFGWIETKFDEDGEEIEIYHKEWVIEIGGETVGKIINEYEAQLGGKPKYIDLSNVNMVAEYLMTLLPEVVLGK